MFHFVKGNQRETLFLYDWSLFYNKLLTGPLLLPLLITK